MDEKQIKADLASAQAFIDPEVNVPLKNVRHERFCQEYVIDLAGGRAAVRAGYGVQNAVNAASSLLTRPDIKARVDQLKAASAKRLEITADRIRAEYAKLAFSNIGDFTDVTEDGEYVGVNLAMVDRDTMAAVQSLETETVRDPVDHKKVIVKNKLKLHEKKGALDALAKLTGLDKGTNVILQGPDGQPVFPRIIVEIVRPGSE